MCWTADIGLEVHVELSTQTKIFCGCAASFGSSPNTLCCPVCTGQPGALPVLNRRVLEYAIRTGLALGCEIANTTFFDRKNYFYPDQPRGYQISQLRSTVCKMGGLYLDKPEGKVFVTIEELHMEDDAGKIIYDKSGNLLIDYNRSGIALLEIVSAPDIHSPEDAAMFVEELAAILRAIGVSDCRMQEGSLRVDVNLSVRREGQGLGVRTEMKNLGSLKSVRQAIKHEADRQIKVLESGGHILQETRRWDEDAGVSVTMRAKEEKGDYRYFPDPDLPTIAISKEMIQAQIDLIPELPQSKRERYKQQYGISQQDCRTLTFDAEITTLFEAAVSMGAEPQEAVKWICGDLLRLTKESGKTLSKSFMTAEKLKEIIQMVSSGEITRANGRQLLEALFYESGSPREYAGRHGLHMVDNRKEIEKAVRDVAEAFPRQFNEYKTGKLKVRDYLMGRVMGLMNGRGDPALIVSALEDLKLQTGE